MFFSTSEQTTEFCGDAGHRPRPEVWATAARGMKCPGFPDLPWDEVAHSCPSSTARARAIPVACCQAFSSACGPAATSTLASCRAARAGQERPRFDGTDRARSRRSTPTGRSRNRGRQARLIAIDARRHTPRSAGRPGLPRLGRHVRGSNAVPLALPQPSRNVTASTLIEYAEALHSLSVRSISRVPSTDCGAYLSGTGIALPSLA